MAILTKEQILSANDSVTEEVAVKQWGGSVLMKTLSGCERDTFEQKCVDRRKGKNSMDLRGLKVALVAMCVVDSEGNHLFTEKDLADLNKKSSAALNALFEKAQEMNGLREEDLELAEGN